MKKELQLELVKKYPNLFRNFGGDMRQTCMAWGFDFGDGWYGLIDEIGSKLKELGVEGNVIADQTKEKFGGLRFYYTVENVKKSFFDRHYMPTNFVIKAIWYFKPIVHLRSYIRFIFHRLRIIVFGMTLFEKIVKIIEDAEEKSYKVCEWCGTEENVSQTRGWIVTLCNKCMEERNKR